MGKQPKVWNKAQRRVAFYRSFHHWATALNDIARNDITLAGEGNNERTPMLPEVPNVMRALAMQFCIRLIRTREKMEIESGDGLPGALIQFTQKALEIYNGFLAESFPGVTLRGDKRKLAALTSLEQYISMNAFEALAIEAQDPAFDEKAEGEFWKDILRGLADADKSTVIMSAFERVWLYGMQSYVDALKVDNHATSTVRH